MFEEIAKIVQSPQFQNVGAELRRIGNPAAFQEEQRAKASQLQGQLAQQQMQQLEIEARRQEALAQLNQQLLGGNTPVNVDDYLRQAATIDPSYLGKYLEYQQSKQPDYKVQEVNGALVRYDANDPNSMPQIISQPEKPMSAKEIQEMQQAEEKDKMSKEGALTQGKIVLETVNEALKQVDAPRTSGVLGQVGSFVGGTNAYNLDKSIDTIKANLSFDTLAKMREASPTGGALGSITENELKLLGSTIASLDIGMSDEQKKKNLNKIKTHTQNWMKAMDKAGKGDEASKVIGGEVKLNRGNEDRKAQLRAEIARLKGGAQ